MTVSPDTTSPCYLCVQSHIPYDDYYAHSDNAPSVSLRLSACCGAECAQTLLLSTDKLRDRIGNLNLSVNVVQHDDALSI